MMHSSSLRPMKTTQKGYTIVELSIAVAIAGVLLVGAIGLVQTVLATSRANDTISSLARTFAQIEKIWADAPNYTGLNLEPLVAAGAFNDLTVTGAAGARTVTHRFNRNVFAGTLPNYPAAAQERGYWITYAGIPAKVCADIVTSAAAAGVKGILITPEANINSTTAATAKTTAEANLLVHANGSGFASLAAGATSALAYDGITPNVNIVNMTAANGCGTANSTVAVTMASFK